MANSVKIKIEGDDSSYSKTIENLASKTKASMADVKAGIDLATQALNKFAEVAKKGIDYNAQMEQLQTSFEVMTGSAEKAAETVQKLRKLGAETPYETSDLASITQLLMQYGFAADDAVEKMTMLGDIAQGNVQNMASIATGYAQMSSAGKVNLQDIKQMINGGFNPLQEISERTGESMSDLYDRISDGKMSVDEITESMKYATSEGGKFYQSMEKQSQTLSGQLSTLSDNVNELLGSLTSGMSDELAGNLLPAVNEMIGQLQSAFNSGGMDSLINTATDMIPDLLNMLTGKLESALSGISKWAPKAAKALMQALPSAIKSATSVIPQITTALYDVASVVLTDLIGMLPELVPQLMEGAMNLVTSMVTGLNSMVNGVFDGVEKMFHQEQTKIMGMWVDDSELAKYDFNLEVTSEVTDNTDAESIRTQVQSAVDTVKTALEKVEGIDADSLSTAFISGDTQSTLSAAFAKYGLDLASAETIAGEITEGQKAISTAIEGLGLSEEAQTQLNEMISDENTTGEEITQFLVDCGVDGEQASAAAKTITDGRDQINDAIEDLPTDIQAQIQSSQADFYSTRGLLQTSLSMMGVTGTTADTVLGSYDTFSNSLTGKITGIFDNIQQTLTDGVPDDPDKMDQLEATVREWARDAHDKIAGWYEDEVSKLDTTDADYAEQIAALQERRDALDQSVDQSVENATTYINEMAGKTTGYVEDHLEELEGLAEKAGVIASEIDALSGAVTSEGKTNYDLARGGARLTSEEYNLAVNYVVSDYKIDEQSATNAYNSAVEELKEKWKNKEISTEEYNVQVENLGAERDAAIQKAREEYQDMLAQIFAGMADSEEIDDTLRQAVQKYASADEMRKIIDEVGNNEDYSNVTGGLLEKIAEHFGMTDVLEKAQLENPDVLISYLQEWATELEEEAETAIEGTDTTKLAAFYQNLLEGGFLEGTELANNDGNTMITLLKSMFDIPEDQLETVATEENEKLLESAAERATAALEDQQKVQEVAAEAAEKANFLQAVLDSIVDTESGEIDKSKISDEVWQMIADAMGVEDTEFMRDSLGANDIVSVLNGMINDALAEAEAGIESGRDGVASSTEYTTQGALDTFAEKNDDFYAAGKRHALEYKRGYDDFMMIESPSKKMRESGRYTGEGLIQGLNESMAGAVAIAKAVGGEITTSANLSSTSRVEMPNLLQTITAANEQNSTPVTLDGKQIATIQGNNNRKQLAFERARIARGYGY